MKKFTVLLLILFTSLSSFSQTGKIRISFAGFDCYRETWDDILHTDGKGDEVYFTFGITLADKNGNTKINYDKRTPVYGDATGAYNNRVNVGSFVDAFGNKRGGIKGGDTYRCNDIIGEFDMNDGDILSIIPTGWEHDPISDNSMSFMTTLKGFTTSINQKLAPILIGLNISTGNLAGLIFNSTNLGVPKTRAGGEQGELGKAGTRPIGMEKYGDYSPKIIGLNTKNLNTIINSNMGFGNGVIAVNYDEVALGNHRDHGIYSILVKIEFFPTNNVTTTNVSTTTKPAMSSGTAPTTSTSFSKSTTNNKMLSVTKLQPSFSIIGVWSGAWGNAQNALTNNWQFQFNNDGSMKVLNSDGATLANGSYTFNNNVIAATYNYTGGGTFSIYGNYETNSGKLIGTWGSKSSNTDGGKWAMLKK